MDYHKTACRKRRGVFYRLAVRSVPFLLLGLLLYPYHCLAQQLRKQVSVEDYSKWGTLQFQGISPKGGWISYRMLYENDKDTLFITSATTGISYDFPQTAGAKISPDDKNALLQLDKGQLCLLELATGKKKLFDGASKADYDAKGNIVFIEDRGKGKELVILKSVGGKEQRFAGVYGYACSPDGMLALAKNKQVLIVTGNKIVDSIRVAAAEVQGMLWSDKGTLAFFNGTAAKESKLYCYSIHKKRLHALGDEQLALDSEFFRLYGNQLRFSDDGTTIYTDVLGTTPVARDTLVEVWTSSSSYEYPADNLMKDPANVPHLIAWHPEQGNVERIGKQGRQNVMILPGGTTALLRTPVHATGRAMDVGDADYYLTALSGKQEPYRIITASMGDGTVTASRCGRYLSFSSGSGVQLFDVVTKQLRSIGSELPGKSTKDGRILGIAGFTTDSRYAVVYDSNDLWLVALGKGKSLRITEGAEQGTVFRTDKSHLKMAPFAGLMGSNLDLEEGIIITAFSAQKTSSYYRYTKENGLTMLSVPNANITAFDRHPNGKGYVYLAQRYDTPPYIIYGDSKGESVVYQSNTHYKRYEWPRFELLDYKNSEGEPLQAILIYPSDYEAGKHYPMVTYIYERLSDGFHNYMQPVTEQYIGFSAPSYFLNGYFVLMPDIAFTENEPGPSALDCVTAAVSVAVRHTTVDKERIGIYGHSFGGYLVNYILTQTSLFRAAVSGAGASDLINYYLTMNFHRSISNSWKFESGQYRIRATPMERQDLYLCNSPISGVSKIATPLLSWAGKDDDSVDFRQSVAMHLALRRLGSESTLLLYPGQGHILRSRAAKLDLTARVMEWFEKYLKPDGN